MRNNVVRHSKAAMDALVLTALAATPYLTVYVLARVFDVPDAARTAAWPAALVPVLVGAWALAHALRTRQVHLHVVHPVAWARHNLHTHHTAHAA